MSEYLYVVNIYKDYKGYDERHEGFAVFLDNDSVVDDIKEFILNNGFCITLQEALADIKNKRRVLGKKPWHHEVAQMNKGDLINFETYSPYCFSDFIVSRVQPNELRGYFQPNTGEYRDRIRAALFSGADEIC